MKFSASARHAEEFERALRGDSDAEAFQPELAVLTRLTAFEVRPDPSFSAALRASLLESAAETAVAVPTAHPPRPARSRWRLAAPAVAVALVSGGVAFAVTGMQARPTSTQAIATSPATTALSTANAQLAAITQQLRTGRPTAATLTSLRDQAIRLQQLLTSAYASGQNPAAITELHEFAVTAITELTGLRSDIPADLQSAYLATLQTLRSIATTAENTCAVCHLAPLQIPDVQASAGVRLPTSPPSPVGSASIQTPATSPPASASVSASVPPPTPSASTSPSPVATPSGLPTITAPPLPSVPTATPPQLPTVTPTIPF